MKTIRTPYVVAAASLLVLLVGCSGGRPIPDQGAGAASSASAEQEAAAPVADQSKADACQMLVTSLATISQSASTMSTTDPQAALATFKDAAGRAQNDLSGIANAEIAPLAQDVGAKLNDYVAFLESVSQDPSKASQIADQISAFQTSLATAVTACQS